MSFNAKAKVLMNFRQWQDANLPVYGSLICYDLALNIINLADTKEYVGLKSLYRSMPYSEAQLRRDIRRLEADGWVGIHNCSQDERNRAIAPTPKMLKSYDEYFSRYTELTQALQTLK